MKAYAIYPAAGVIGRDRHGPRVQECIDAVTELVVKHLRAEGEVFHCIVDWNGAEPRFLRFDTESLLTERVRACVEPFDGDFGCFHGNVIRSAATCRAASFGYDGQAFLCLRHGDLEPVSPDISLLEVHEYSELLAGTDYFDGNGWDPDSD